jgi:hypothetical protein
MNPIMASHFLRLSKCTPLAGRASTLKQEADRWPASWQGSQKQLPKYTKLESKIVTPAVAGNGPEKDCYMYPVPS